MGIDRFIEDVDDIYVYFQTYAYAGTAMASAEAEPRTRLPQARSRHSPPTAPCRRCGRDGAPNPMPQPDALFYGVALRDGTPLTSGTLTAVLPRVGTIRPQIAPITGTTYNYAIAIPLDYYDPDETNYLDRLGPGGRDRPVHDQRRACPPAGHGRHGLPGLSASTWWAAATP